MRIYLVRHGETKANTDKSELSREANHTIPLTEKGHRQSLEVGEFLASHFLETSGFQTNISCHNPYLLIRLWNSPYIRTRQTAQCILDTCKSSGLIGGKGQSHSWFLDRKEHIFLAEQQLGLFEGLTLAEREELFPKMLAHYEKCKRGKGMMWPQLPMGESRFNVCQRVHQIFPTFHRDCEKEGIDTLVIVAHGTSLRAFVTMWLNKTPEWLNDEPEPKNCSVRLLVDSTDHGYIFKGFE